MAPSSASSGRCCAWSVDYERPVPDMCRVAPDGYIQEAVLEKIVTFPGSVGFYAVAMSSRAPQAERSGNAASRPGLAAELGAAEKVRRYGVDVLPVVFDAGGRRGAQGLASLRSLAMAARQHADALGGRPLWQCWRVELETCLWLSSDDVVLLGLGHSAFTLCPGRPLATSGTAARGRVVRVG